MPNHFNHLFSDFVALFFPNICVGCEEALPKGMQYICPACQFNLPKTNNYKAEVPHIVQKLSGSIHFNLLLAYLHFHKKGIVQKLLHELKYNHKEEIGVMLGRWYGHDLLLSGFEKAFDMIIPVPLHPSKLKKRGYNQSEAFAIGLAEVLKAEVSVDELIRTKASETQTRKSRMDRLKNVESIFEVKDSAVFVGKKVLLVDDVLTTGATLLACGNQLIKAQVKELSFGVIAATQ